MKLKKISFISIFSGAIFFITETPIFAQGATKTTSSTGIGCGGGVGPIAQILCGNKDPAATGGQLNKTVSVIIGVMTAVAALWFILQFITAGFQWIQSGGDKNNLNEARDKITNSLIGLIIVVAAWIVMGIVGQVLGISILNPGQILLNLGQ